MSTGVDAMVGSWGARASHGILDESNDVPLRLRQAGVVGMCGYRLCDGPPQRLVVLPGLAVRVMISVNGVAVRVADATVDPPLWTGSTAVAFGARTRAALASADRELMCLQILLAPWAAFRVFGVPRNDLGGVAADLAAPGGAALRAVVARLDHATGWEQRFAIAGAELSRRCIHGQAAAPVVVKALETLRHSGGRISVQALATICGCSQRLLERRFGEQVGASPKAVARVVRLRRAVGLLARGLAVGDVAVECGYCDQAHLTREFTAMVGSPPARFVQEHRVLGDAGEYECAFIQDSGRGASEDQSRDAGTRTGGPARFHEEPQREEIP
ncbi:MAG: helix-turn-helix domain-containing protein [Actinocrinis sp.]